MIQPYEITIGSLIKTNKGEIIKVESISTKRQHRKVGYHKDGDISHIHYVRLAQCEGIPLTEDILLANDFDMYCGKTRWYSYDSCTIKADISKTDIMGDFYLEVGYIKRTIHNVHELQRALRICGVNDLADNFKLKEE